MSLDFTYTCAIQKEALSCWGKNKYGQLGIGTNKDSPTPQIVKSLNSGVTAVSLGFAYACAIQKGDLSCWGKVNNNLKTIKSIEFLAIRNLNICISENSILKCLGFNGYGQLGNGTKEPLLQFQQVKGIEKGKTQFKMSDRHSCSLQKEALKCWGDNKYGQLGTALWRKNWRFSF